MSNSKNSNPFGDKRTALAFFISLIVIISYTELVLKPEDLKRAQPALTSQAGTVESTRTAPTAQPILAAQSTDSSTPAAVTATNTTPAPTGLPTLTQLDESPSLSVSTSKYQAEFLQLGGALRHFRLAEHTKSLGEKEPLDLVTYNENTPLPFVVELLGGQDALIEFGEPVVTPQSAKKGNSVRVAKDEEVQIEYVAQLQNGSTYSKRYSFTGGSYFVDIAINLSSPPAGALPLSFSWTTTVAEEVATNSYDPVNFSFFLPTDKVEHTQITELETGTNLAQDARWGSLGDKYFMATLVSKEGAETITATRTDDNYSIKATGERDQLKTRIFIGPKNYSELKDINVSELHRTVNMGFFSFLAIPLLTAINFLYSILGNYGLAIILLTLLIKFGFLPLTQVSLRSMKAMQDLQPEIKALKERVKDPTQLNQETFALYKRKGVNPMGGCFPMLIQIPVFLGLYNALLNATELRHAPFALWITDLSAPEALHIAGIPIPVMIILMGLSMFFQQLLMPSNMDEQQKKIMMFMPVVFTIMFIVFPFPSGLVLYWLVNNLISIVQQVYLRTERSMSPVKASILASIAIFIGSWGLTLA